MPLTEGSEAVKETLSDALAWIAFAAFTVWISSIVLGLSSLWGTFNDIWSAIEAIRNCATSHCEMRFSFDHFASDTTLLGIPTDWVAAIRGPAFWTWIIIIFFQSFYVRSFRVAPWRTPRYFQSQDA